MKIVPQYFNTLTSNEIPKNIKLDYYARKMDAQNRSIDHNKGGNPYRTRK